MVETSRNPAGRPSLSEPFRTVGARIADRLAPASEASCGAAADRAAPGPSGVSA